MTNNQYRHTNLTKTIELVEQRLAARNNDARRLQRELAMVEQQRAYDSALQGQFQAGEEEVRMLQAAPTSSGDASVSLSPHTFL
ncbi:MAG: hypothetical protein HC876_16355 [Chloroflexaceae bacterium]|nr:hypothetical protein [Chloroflexaceae bacterium]NJO84676.1 hypothetical protein [Blastochloris sp.]